jgi:hypothetical protein
MLVAKNLKKAHKVYRRRSAKPGDPSSPDGGSYPYTAADGSTLLDIKFCVSLMFSHDATGLLESDLSLSIRRDIFIAWVCSCLVE